jgi:hypothetical protein
MSDNLEIDISDSELAEIMPRVSPSQALSPITLSCQSGLISTILDVQPVGIQETTIGVDNKPVKKPRKPRVSKKTATADFSLGGLSETATPSTTTPSTATPSTATPSKSKSDKSKADSEQSFTLGLTKDCFTPEELAINPLTQIFIENSRVSNNELIKYQAVRAGILDYKCYGKGCPTKDGNWRRRMGFLILVRNNNRESDLRMTNLSLLCPNCYCQEKGAMAFEKVKKEIIQTCVFCSAPLDTKYNSNKCGRCAWQIKNQIQKSANIDRLSRAFCTDVEGLSASNMAILMNSSILDEGTTGGGSGFMHGDTHKYSAAAVSFGSGTRLLPRQNVNPALLRIENSASLKRLFMELSEQQ